jgi:hypothetical protein
MRKLLLTLVLVTATAASASAQSEQLSIATSKRVVVYGARVQVSGTLRGQPAGTPVVLAIRRQGDSRFVPVSNSLVGSSGRWSFSFEPTVSAQLQARAGEVSSRIATVRVKPKLMLTRRRDALFARAVAARSFKGRHVWFQRRTKQGRWRSLRKVVLDDPPRRFRVRLPSGVSRVRVSLSRRQAGPGYEPTVSRVLVLRRP